MPHEHPIRGSGTETEMKKPSIENQWWERRGTMVYGQDFGPGTAIMVIECDSADEAQRVVDEHNGALEGGAA